MAVDDHPLMEIFSGWDGYQISLVRAVESLSSEILAFRPIADRRSVGELAAHIAFGRIDWFSRMGAAGSSELAEEISLLWGDGRGPEAAIADSSPEIVRWLNASWHMIENNLRAWTTADLHHTYLQTYTGNTYAVSRQWTIWRIMAHDIHHGGQLSILLSMQRIDPPDLSDNGGHIIEPPLADKALG